MELCRESLMHTPRLVDRPRGLARTTPIQSETLD
jgi:hypothetical protein